MRRLYDAVAIGAQEHRRQLIGHDDENIGLFGHAASVRAIAQRFNGAPAPRNAKPQKFDAAMRRLTWRSSAASIRPAAQRAPRRRAPARAPAASAPRSPRRPPRR